MEVHKHPHHVTHKKKWSEYLLEFSMIFFAVFLGFIAENKREHAVEYQKEGEYMQSIVEDVIKDTAMLSVSEQAVIQVVGKLDTIVEILSIRKLDEESIKNLYRANLGSLSFFGPSFTDRTSQQLKNAGTMLLIRNRSVADSIINYWSGSYEMNQANSLAEEYKFGARNLSYKIFDQIYYSKKNKSSEYIHPKLMTDDDLVLTEYANRLSHIRNLISNVYLRMLIAQKERAKNLIQYIKAQYKLK